MSETPVFLIDTASRLQRCVAAVVRAHGFRAALLIPGILLLPPGQAETGQESTPYLLTKVTVEGSARYERSAIAQATGMNVGATVTLADLKKAAEELGTLGIFAQVSYRYSTRGNTLTASFTVQDAPGMMPCTFENFLWFSPRDLQEGVRARVPLFDGSVPAGGKMLDLIAAQLQTMLEARGIRAQVLYAPHGALGGPVTSMGFHEAGVPLPVRRLEFPGVAKVDVALLQEAAKPLLDKDYDPSFAVDLAHGGILQVYRQRGFLRAAFGQPVPRLMTEDPMPNAVEITIPVTEGEQYRVKEITWSGESAIPYEELGKTLHATVGNPLDAVQLEQDVLGFSLLLHPKGYLKADAMFRPVLDDDAHTAAVQIQVRQGALYRMGKLEIAGLDDALAASLVQRSRLHAGDPYDYTYWSRFVGENQSRLPVNDSGWKFNPLSSINEDTKTVDVKLVFAPRASH